MKRSRVSTFLVVFLGFPGPLFAKAGKDLNTQMMNATVKLANPKSTATAFVLTRTTPGPSPKRQHILVTAAHVLEQMSGEEAVAFFRKKESEGVYKKLPLKIAIRKAGKALWTRHPALDIAAMYVTPPEKAVFPQLPLDLLATDQTLKQHKIHPGDSLRCLGYPHQLEANDAGFPVLRSGAIASYPLLPAKTNKTFLLNYNSFEGDSGGPVYLAESHRMVDSKKEPVQVRLILGLVLGQHFIDVDTRTAYETRKVRYRLGLAIVVQAIYIRETIDRLPPRQ
jgi:hypothetical protein